MNNNNEINQKNQKLQAELEELTLKLQEEITPNFEVGSKKLATKQREYDQLQAEVEKLKTGYNGDENSYKEYQKQLKEFNQFRWLRKKGTTQLTNRFAAVKVWGTDYIADRSMPRTFLRSFLTTLMNFDAPDNVKITNAFNNRTGPQALVANTNGNNPTKFSADWVVSEWAKYVDYFKKMIALGSEADIIKKAEIVMPGLLPVRNVANWISANANTRSHLDSVLFGSASFIPYWQQVHVQNSGYTYADIKESELLEFLEFLFPTNVATSTNQLINLQAGQTAGSANDYRLTSGANNYDLHSKDYKNLTLFPLYEASNTKPSSISVTHGLDRNNLKFEWKFKQGSADNWIIKRYAHEFKNAPANNLNNFEGVVRLFNEVFSPTQTQIRQWIQEVNDPDADKSSALYALTHGYNLNKDKLINGQEIIPVSEPNTDEYAKKNSELISKELELEEVKKEQNLILSERSLVQKEIIRLKKELGQWTKKDKNALHAKLKQAHLKIEAKYDASTKKWTTKTSSKQTWEFWSEFTTNYDDYLELLGEDETQWKDPEKDLINSKLKPGTHQYFTEVVQANYNNLTANYQRFIIGKTPKTKTVDQYFEEWLKDSKNAKLAEKIVRDLENLKNFVKIDGETLGDVLQKISESDLIKADLESALRRVLDSDYSPNIKAKWAKTEYAVGDKFWKLIKEFYQKSDQPWKDHVKANQGTHDNLKDWLKDADLDCEAFIAAIRLWQIKHYTGLRGDERQELETKQGQEIMAWFIEVDKFGYSYHDITVNGQEAPKLYEKLKERHLKINDILGLDKNRDVAIINKWINFKAYNSKEKLETLFKDLWEETPPTKEGEKPTKKLKAEFLTFIGQSSWQDFLKAKEPAEVMAAIRRYELKNLSEKDITKQPQGEGEEFTKSKSLITAELEKIKAKYEELKTVGSLTEVESELYRKVTQHLMAVQKMEAKVAPKTVDDGPKPKITESEAKEPEPEKGLWAKYKVQIVVSSIVALLGIGAALWYFLGKKKDDGSEEESSDEAE